MNTDEQPGKAVLRWSDGQIGQDDAEGGPFGVQVINGGSLGPGDQCPITDDGDHDETGYLTAIGGGPGEVGALPGVWAE